MRTTIPGEIHGATETPIFDALLTEHEQSLPLIHLSNALRGPRTHGGLDRHDRQSHADRPGHPLGLEPKFVPSAEVPVLPRRRAH